MGEYSPEPWDTEERARQARAHDEFMAARRRRQTVVFLCIVALVAVVFLAAMALARDWVRIGGKTATPVACPVSTVAPAANTKVRVLNTTKKAGMAGSVANALKARGFVVDGIDNSPQPVRGVAVVVYGPGTEKQARAVAGQIAGATLQRRDGHTDPVVDLMLGDNFKALIRAEEVKATPAPSPSGCVPAP